MAPERVHQVRQEMSDRCVAGEQHGHHVGHDLGVTERRSCRLCRDQDREQVVVALHAAARQFRAQQRNDLGPITLRERWTRGTTFAAEQALRKLAGLPRGIRAKAEHAAEPTE
ncbi:hypothetical protein XI09_07080 [Bradyrhizobium sp. CCBAU 11386]|nr:hypothetical protein [Bradyrhizobium sp. CCBAU 11386]